MPERKVRLECEIDSDVMAGLRFVARKEKRSVSEMVSLFLKRGVGHLSEEHGSPGFVLGGCGTPAQEEEGMDGGEDISLRNLEHADRASIRRVINYLESGGTLGSNIRISDDGFDKIG